MKNHPAFFDLPSERTANHVGVSTFTLCGEEDLDDNDFPDFYEVVIRTRGPGMLRIALERVQQDLGTLLAAVSPLEPAPCPICQKRPSVTQRTAEGATIPTMWYVECLATPPDKPHRLCVNATGRDMAVNRWSRLVTSERLTRKITAQGATPRRKTL